MDECSVYKLLKYKGVSFYHTCFTDENWEYISTFSSKKEAEKYIENEKGRFVLQDVFNGKIIFDRR